MAVGEIDVLHMAVLSSADPGHLGATGVEVGEIDIAYRGAKAMLLNVDAHGDAVAAVDDDVVKADVFDQRCLKALIGHTVRIGISRQPHTDAEAGFCNVQVGEGHIPHNAIVDITQTHTAGVAGKVAVGDGDFFANGVFQQHRRIGTDNDAVITAGNIAIGNIHVAAAVDVDAVIVGDVHSRQDLRPVEMDVVTVTDPVAPATRLVAHGHILDQHIFAAKEENHTGRGDAGNMGV